MQSIIHKMTVTNQIVIKSAMGVTLKMLIFAFLVFPQGAFSFFYKHLDCKSNHLLNRPFPFLFCLPGNCEPDLVDLMMEESQMVPVQFSKIPEEEDTRRFLMQLGNQSSVVSIFLKLVMGRIKLGLSLVRFSVEIAR
jgi:hypothetical protein